MNNGEVHIYAPQPTRKNILSGDCPDCKQRTKFIGLFTEWYGWDTTCLRCGRKWADGEWMALDFVRGSRQKSIDSAKRAYRRVSHDR